MHYSSGLLTVVVFLIFIKPLIKDRALLFLAAYSLLDLFLNYYTKNFNKTLSLYVWSTFTLVEYALFTYILWLNIKNKIFKKAILWISIAFISFTVIYNVKTNFKNIDSIPIGMETILIFIYSFFYLYEQMNDATVLFIYSKYQFWVVIGFLIYLAGSFFIFIFANRVKDVARYWYITNAFYVFMNLMFLIAFYIKIKKSRSFPFTRILSFLN